MKRLESTAPLSFEETIPLIVAAQAGDVDARNRVIAANMRLVRRIASPMVTAAGLSESIDDVVNAAVAGPRGGGGLVRAIERFDTTRGKRFTTFATYWVRLAVRDAIAELRSVETRGGRGQEWERVKAVREKLVAEMGRAPTAREVKARCVHLGIEAPSDRILERLAFARQQSRVEVEEIAAPDDTALDAERSELHEQLAVALEALPQQQRDVLRAVNGIGRDEPATHEAIAAELGISRRAVVKAIARGLKALKRRLA